MPKQTCKECESEDFNIIGDEVVCKFCGEAAGLFKSGTWRADKPVDHAEDLKRLMREIKMEQGSRRNKQGIEETKRLINGLLFGNQPGPKVPPPCPKRVYYQNGHIN